MHYMLEQRRLKVVHAVWEEYDLARTLHPDWHQDLVRGASTAIEEAGETTQAVNDYCLHNKGSIEAIRNEAIQAAAMYIRFLVESEELWAKSTTPTTPTIQQS